MLKLTRARFLLFGRYRVSRKPILELAHLLVIITCFRVDEAQMLEFAQPSTQLSYVL
jgi:hypothetical protein